MLFGDANRGAELIDLYGCGACHVVPGVSGARGTVGPSLEGFANRAYVAGILPNRPGDLIRWLIDPPAFAPQTAMPDMDIPEEAARDMAAYLYELRGV
ncbi:cytochrome C [Jannaschia sp. EhC01]|nr:cytochrome C [Jannaschia sp. EhC01]